MAKKKFRFNENRVKHQELISQYKSINILIERAQENSAAKKKELLEQLRKISDKTSHEYIKTSNEINNLQGIDDSTVQKYFNSFKVIFDRAHEEYGITKVKDLTPEITLEILDKKADEGVSSSTIRNYGNALNYINKAAHWNNVKGLKEINITDHEKVLDFYKTNEIERKASSSTRYHASTEDCKRVLNKMYEYNPELAKIAHYSFDTGLRVTDCIKQKEEHVNIDTGRNFAANSKGGLNNIVYADLTEKDKERQRNWKTESDKETGRLFPRMKDGNGNYKSDEQVRLEIAKLTSKCAKELGIGTKDSRFTTHSFRGNFGLRKAEKFAKDQKNIDKIINEKIKEQSRLRAKYEEMLKRSKDKIKNPEERRNRELTVYQKIKWLVSVELNHSREDVVRHYVTDKELKSIVDKYK